MKSTTSIYSFLLTLWAIVALSRPQAFAQCGTAVPTQFSSWDWEISGGNPSSPNTAYCDTWSANIAFGNTVVRRTMGAPWIRPASPALQAINFANDYRKADGWELLRFDFGGTQALQTPYFILYQKTTGVLRIFAYIADTNPLTGVVFTVRQSPNNATSSGRNTANLSISQYPVITPDKYSSQAPSDNEVITYVGFLGSAQSWAVGQFTVMLDPNLADASHNLNSLQFQVYGLVESTVKINGGFQFATDFAMAGPASKASQNQTPGAAVGALQIIANGQKFLGDLSSVQKKLDDVKKGATDFAGDLGANPQGIFLDLQRIANGVKIAAGSNKLKTITDAASALGGFLGLAGSIIGFFSDDATSSAKSAFVPTVSKGTINLDGTITTQAPRLSFFMLVPGTKHYANNSGSTNTPANSRSQLPFYDCPLGVFNLQATPVLRKVDYTRLSRAHFRGYNFNIQYNGKNDPTVKCTSYRLDRDIQPIVNVASGMEIRSVKYAICKKIPLSDVSIPYTTINDPSYPAFDFQRDYKFIYSQVINGGLEVYPVEASTSGNTPSVVVQTPFLDAHCSGNYMPFNALKETADSPVFLRVIAELVKTGAPATAVPLLFSQDYAVDLIDDSQAATYQDHTYGVSEQPPYRLYYQSYFGLGQTLTSPYEATVIKTGQLEYSYIFNPNNNNHNLEVANSLLTFDSNSNVNVTSGGYSVYPNYPVVFRANSEVQIMGALSADPGNELVITTDLASLSTTVEYSRCTPSNSWYIPQFGIYSQPCNYNLDAARILSNASAASIEVPKLTVYPNPASGNTVAQLKVPQDECIEHLTLYGMNGTTSWEKAYSCNHDLKVDVPLTKLPSGIYVLVASTTKGTYTTKIIVE